MHYHVSMSIYELVASYDCEADDAVDALNQARAAFTEAEWHDYNGIEADVINLDVPPDYMPSDLVLKFLDRWEHGYKYLSGGYQYFF